MDGVFCRILVKDCNILCDAESQPVGIQFVIVHTKTILFGEIVEHFFMLNTCFVHITKNISRNMILNSGS